MRAICIGLLSFALWSAGPVNAQDAPPEAVPAIGQARVYKQSGGRPREIELFFPPQHDPKTAKVPGLILFHGGGWTGGTRNQFRPACEYFARRGLVTATVSYQMLTKAQSAQLPPGETNKRVCITDAKSALRWFKQHADELGVDPARIVTGGGSAGGHISVLATTNPDLNDPADPAGIDTSVVAYLLFNPAFAVSDVRDPQVDGNRHVTRDLAPAIVFFGTKDDAWNPGWKAVQKTLQVRGNTTTEVFLAEGQEHGFFNREPWLSATLREADRFLVRRGILSGEPTRIVPRPGADLTPPAKEHAADKPKP